MKIPTKYKARPNASKIEIRPLPLCAVPLCETFVSLCLCGEYVCAKKRFASLPIANQPQPRESAQQAEALLDALEGMASQGQNAAFVAARAEAAALVVNAAEALPPGARHRVARAIRISEWAAGEAGAHTLAATACRDSSGRVSSIVARRRTWPVRPSKR